MMRFFRYAYGMIRCALTVFAIGIGVCVSFQCTDAVAEDPSAGGVRLRRPSAVLATADGSHVLIASSTNATLISTDLEGMKKRELHVPAPVLDLVWLQPGASSLAITAEPALLLQVYCDDSSRETKSVELAIRPAKMALNDDGTYAAITSTWDKCALIVPLDADGLCPDRVITRVSLDFPPREIVCIGETRFLVADAFGGELAVVDTKTGTVIASHQINGHHIGGLVCDYGSNSVLLSHQRLSKIAETSFDDIHWGTLMQNLVTQIPLPSLLQSGDKIAAKSRQYRLGKPGHGCADPSSIVSLSEGRFAVAISGTDEVALGRLGSKAFQFVSVGAKPTKLVWVGVDQLLCMNELDEIVSILSLKDDLQLVGTLGTPRTQLESAERGERDFYSGRLSHDGWMSCSSCHIDGFTPDLAVDTFGDGQFGNAKRIPSLFNVHATGPWGWDGSKKSLAEQIESTLHSTMCRDEDDREQKSDHDVTVGLIAFLESQDRDRRKALQDGDSQLGEMLFQNRGCAKCHDPASRFTSADVYDVGVNDEYGLQKFNPPALSQLKLRRAFFHDGRFKSLDEVLRNHPTANADFSAQELEQLKTYLLSL